MNTMMLSILAQCHSVQQMIAYTFSHRKFQSTGEPSSTSFSFLSLQRQSSFDGTPTLRKSKSVSRQSSIASNFEHAAEEDSDEEPVEMDSDFVKSQVS